VFVALVMQHAKRIHRVMLSPVACLAVQYFSTLADKGHDFRKIVIGHKICVLIFSTNLSGKFLFLKRIQRGIIINVHRSSFKAPAVPVLF
jgi:hypothetical protein